MVLAWKMTGNLIEYGRSLNIKTTYFMKTIKIIAVAVVLFVALSFGVSKQIPPVEKANEEVKVAPHKLHGPIGMSDEDQF